MHSPDSLLGRIFQARYFPNGEFTEATLGPRPSATWRGILQARPYVLKGLRVRIWNGFHTTIWGSSWIPDDGNFKVITPKPENTFFPQRVADLIHPTTDTWNKEMIESCLWPVDHARVLAIPIGAAMANDQVVWHYDRRAADLPSVLATE